MIYETVKVLVLVDLNRIYLLFHEMFWHTV